MSVQTIYLLATGTVPQGLEKEAEGHGMVLDVVPFIDIEYPDGIGGLGSLIAKPLTVIFTSVNAVNAVRRYLKQPLPDWRIYCISGATSAAVVELFGEKAVVAKAGSASELVEEIRVREKGKIEEVIFFCGDHRREELPAIGVTEKIVYRTILTPHRIDRTYDGIAFFSPSAVESFFSVNSITAGVSLFAIGKTTETAIRAACTNPVFPGRQPDRAILIREMIDYFLFKT
ncbi:MAG TPA: uroporphyrinogen-III synthase [Puia sp.]|jgi:uroporphyrinogen-III synthase|nr:uroporphyrinogen-III synthase [Puia sp.]